ncbi:MAG TPA: hypothetical protein VF182_19220 [Candidatus Binatia bacterium]|jgi:hypothetical protein
MKSQRVRWEGQSFWQLVFGQSKVNGARYDGENLTTSPWRWPTNTYLQRRRQLLKNSQAFDQADRDEADGGFYDTRYDTGNRALVEFREPGSLRGN